MEESVRVRDKLNSSHLGNVCAFCGTSVNLLLCAGCREVYYCSKQHQKLHWKTHKTTCKRGGTAKNVNKQTTRVSESVENSAVACLETRPKFGLAGDEDFKMSSFLNLGALTIDSDSLDTRLLSGDQVDPSCASASSQVQNNIGSSSFGQVPAFETQRFSISDPLHVHRTDKARKKFKSEAESVVEQQAKETRIADYVVKCLNDYGICVVDNFLNEEKADGILREVTLLNESHVMQDGEIFSRTQTGKRIRCDKITWVEKGDKKCPCISALIHRLDSLMLTCRGRLGNYTISGRTKAMVACYPGRGTYYMKHVDNPKGDGRCVTCIYYLNKGWDVQREGGLLRIYPTMFNQVADIEPKFDRLLFFWSDRRNPHEVQPAYRTRYAITVWFFDQEEREQALTKYRQEKHTTVDSIHKATSVPLTGQMEQHEAAMPHNQSWP